MDPYPSNFLNSRDVLLSVSAIPLFLLDTVRTTIKTALIGNFDLQRGENIKIGKKVLFEGKVVLEDDVVIGDGVYLQNCVIKKGTKIKPGARIVNSTIGENSIICGEVNDSIIGNDAILEKLSYVNNSKIGERFRLGFKSCLGRENEIFCIGDDVLINGGVWIQADIGDNCVVGRGAVLEINLNKNTIVNMKGGKQRIIENVEIII